MPNTWKSTSYKNGWQFEQCIDETEGAMKVIPSICSVFCKIHIQNELFLSFSSLQKRKEFCDALEKSVSKLKFRVLENTTMLQILVLPNIKQLQSIFKIMHDFDPLTKRLDDEILSAFSLNKRDHLNKVTEALQERLRLLMLAQNEVAKLEDSSKQQEFIEAFLEHFPKETLGKLSSENARALDFLNRSPEEHEHIKRATQSRIVKFSDGLNIMTRNTNEGIEAGLQMARSKSKSPVQMSPSLQNSLETELKLNTEMQQLEKAPHGSVSRSETTAFNITENTFLPMLTQTELRMSTDLTLTDTVSGTIVVGKQNTTSLGNGIFDLAEGYESDMRSVSSSF